MAIQVTQLFAAFASIFIMIAVAAIVLAVTDYQEFIERGALITALGALYVFSLLIGASALIVILSTSAHADTPRTIEYFIAHPSERAEVERTCHPSIEGGKSDIECSNAQQAGWDWQYRLAKRMSHSANPDTDLESPVYWMRYPVARRATIEACRHPVPMALRNSKRSCMAAYEADYIATGQPSR
jgi:hypothetical protein